MSSPKSRGSMPFQPSAAPKRAEDNHSLLQEETSSMLRFKGDFFGNFKGFSIAPLKSQEPEPIRPAPPVPMSPTVTKTPIVKRSNTVATVKNHFQNKTIVPSQSVKQVHTSNDELDSSSVPPALPPLNPGSHPRPIISSPILENSTCSAKELISPLRNAPKIPLRPAPRAPEYKRPLSSPDTIITTILPEEEKKPAKESMSTLNRIASFLKSDKKLVQNSKSQVKAAKALDKGSLRTVEISNPILQADIAIPTAAVPVVATVENKPVVMRAQSMRGGNVTQRVAIPTFGSMRHPNGFKRPVSIPTATRPKSPPPPRPPLAELHKDIPGTFKVPSLPGYQKPPGLEESKPNKQSQYDDCLNEALSKIKEERDSVPVTDNIYSVIEEIAVVRSPVKSPDHELNKVKINAGSSESVAGLLGEIVSEIQNRNVESIYSTSTLNRKKKEEIEAKRTIPDSNTAETSSDMYVNTSSMYKTPTGVYSNMNNVKSSASSTSSGYITPSSVNPPILPASTSDANKYPVNKTDKMVGIAQKNLTESSNKSPASLATSIKPTLSTFKGDQKTNFTTTNNNKPSSSTSLQQRNSSNPSIRLGRNINPPKNLTEISNNSDKDISKTNNKTLPSPTSKTGKPKTIPPNIRTRKPSPVRTTALSPVRTAPTSPKTVEKQTTCNSPDLVTSCSKNNNSNLEDNGKSPDVLSGGASLLKKPYLPKSVPKIKSSKSLSSKEDIKVPATAKTTNPLTGSKTITAGTKVAARQNSNVAALQQKFEIKNPTSAKSVVPCKNK